VGTDFVDSLCGLCGLVPFICGLIPFMLFYMFVISVHMYVLRFICLLCLFSYIYVDRLSQGIAVTAAVVGVTWLGY
jgi:hypothetical protein